MDEQLQDLNTRMAAWHTKTSEEKCEVLAACLAATCVVNMQALHLIAGHRHGNDVQMSRMEDTYDLAARTCGLFNALMRRDDP